jgi:hypothetical protein
MGLDKWYKNAKSDDFLFEVGVGRTGTHFGLFKYGENNQVATAPGSTLWDGKDITGLELYPWIADGTEETLELLSSSANDTLAGSGAKKVRIFGLTKTGLYQVEDISMNGITPVQTIGKYWRFFRAYVVESGARAGAAGNITIRYSSTIVGAIVLGNNQTMMALFTIPLGYTGVLVEAHVHSGAKVVDFTLYTRNYGVCDRVRRRAKGVVADDSHLDYKVPVKYAALTDIELRCAAASPPAGDVSGDFAMVLIKENNSVVDIGDFVTIGQGA